MGGSWFWNLGPVGQSHWALLTTLPVGSSLAMGHQWSRMSILDYSPSPMPQYHISGSKWIQHDPSNLGQVRQQLNAKYITWLSDARWACPPPNWSLLFCIWPILHTWKPWEADQLELPERFIQKLLCLNRTRNLRFIQEFLWLNKKAKVTSALWNPCRLPSFISGTATNGYWGGFDAIGWFVACLLLWLIYSVMTFWWKQFMTTIVAKH